MLTDGEASVMDIENAYGQTALHLAARGGHIDVCKLLLDSGADPLAYSDNNHELPKFLYFTHGQHPQDWQFFFTEPNDIYAHDFWTLIEEPSQNCQHTKDSDIALSVPGAWEDPPPRESLDTLFPSNHGASFSANQDCAVEYRKGNEYALDPDFDFSTVTTDRPLESYKSWRAILLDS
ncbi:hypothetical protein BDV96DRAFT_690978 [Lophiotrema nucula]|uniref:Uncharacterized protein n=1 Tax=Lophiotrema nucula TaxID=690887 RepID=A0A6A5YU11_9PLEO|nr:hypothetical protein BDV96DRAFT_690978 [Lophiotrema nucula]